MRIAVAPNAFRGSLTALAATTCIIKGLQQSGLASVETIPMPLADGGNGTLDILVDGLHGRRLRLPTTAPDGSTTQAPIGLLPDGQTAIIEMALASGVELIPVSLRNPLVTTTYGTGELILAARRRGCQRFLIGLGGSATVDGGAGCLQALGARLLDASGKDIPHGGGGLAHLATIDVTALRLWFDNTEIMLLCDVINPLIGLDGAARVFGPQKGADPAMVEVLEANLTHFAEIIRRDVSIDVSTLPGGGSAGGFGAGLAACLNARIVPGGTTLIDLLGYEQKLASADLVITGEGKLDGQTADGKAVQSIAAAAQRVGIPTIAFAGMIEADSIALQAIGIRAAWSIIPGPCTLDEAVTHAAEWLTRAAANLGGFLTLALH